MIGEEKDILVEPTKDKIEGNKQKSGVVENEITTENIKYAGEDIKCRVRERSLGLIGWDNTKTANKHAT